jgi:Tol biopolymer transport system component
MVPLTSYPGRQATPALSPDGKQVAFSWDGEHGDNFDIYVKLVDGGTPLRLTTNPAPEDNPAWSPDGGRIAFLRHSASTADILVIPSLGGQERKLGQVTFTYSNGGLAWSPDGKFLAVVDHPANESAGIYLVSIESGEKHRVAWSPREFYGDGSPSFSPDGNSLAFVRTNRSFFSDDIFVLPLKANAVAAGAPRRIISTLGVIGLDWTPDSRSIVFALVLNAAQGALRIIPAAGGQPQPLTGAGENGWEPSVSRQGNRLAYQRMLADSNIWRLAGPRSNQRTVPPQKWIASTEYDGEPQYSPDGQKIVFSSARSGTVELWTSDANGSAQAQLTSFGGPPPGSPRWSPDSHWIAFDAPQSGKRTFLSLTPKAAPRVW